MSPKSKRKKMTQTQDNFKRMVSLFEENTPENKKRTESLLEAEITKISNQIRFIKKIEAMSIENRQYDKIKTDLMEKKDMKNPVTEWSKVYEDCYKPPENELVAYHYLLKMPIVQTMLKSPSVQVGDELKNDIQNALKILEEWKVDRLDELEKLIEEEAKPILTATPVKRIDSVEELAQQN